MCDTQNEGNMSAHSAKSRMVVAWPCAPVMSKRIWCISRVAYHHVYSAAGASDGGRELGGIGC